MGNLAYPQLTSGALVQYPLRKTKTVRTIKNILPDGSMVLLPDSSTNRTIWQVEYSHLSFADVQALQSHFTACKGPLNAFTFIDPTGNMLVSSADLTTAAWQKSTLLQIQAGILDPFGGTTAQTVANFGQVEQELSQVLVVPANYQYCFSVYAASDEPTSITLFRRGLDSQQLTRMNVCSGWNRLVLSGRLADSGTSLSVGISLDAGIQVKLCGMQLEAQIAPSRYQQTAQVGGVYANAHWAIEELQITVQDTNSYATAVSIEAAA